MNDADRLTILEATKESVLRSLSGLNEELHGVNEKIATIKSRQFIKAHGINRADVEMTFDGMDLRRFEFYKAANAKTERRPWVAYRGSLFSADDFWARRFDDYTGKVRDLGD